MDNNEYNQANSDELALTLSEISAQYQLIKKIARNARCAENTAENIEKIIGNYSSKPDKIKRRINLESACAKMVAESYSKLDPEFKELAKGAYKNFVRDSGYIIDKLSLDLDEDGIQDSTTDIQSTEENNWNIIYKARNEMLDKANYYKNDRNLRNWRINELIDEQASLSKKKIKIDSANKEYMKITGKNNVLYFQYMKCYKKAQECLGIKIQTEQMEGQGDFYSRGKNDRIIENALFPEKIEHKKKKLSGENKRMQRKKKLESIFAKERNDIFDEFNALELTGVDWYKENSTLLKKLDSLSKRDDTICKLATRYSKLIGNENFTNKDLEQYTQCFDIIMGKLLEKIEQEDLKREIQGE
jgi:hypothetical protein